MLCCQRSFGVVSLLALILFATSCDGDARPPLPDIVADFGRDSSEMPMLGVGEDPCEPPENVEAVSLDADKRCRDDENCTIVPQGIRLDPPSYKVSVQFEGDRPEGFSLYILEEGEPLARRTSTYSYSAKAGRYDLLLAHDRPVCEGMPGGALVVARNLDLNEPRTFFASLAEDDVVNATFQLTLQGSNNDPWGRAVWGVVLVPTGIPVFRLDDRGEEGVSALIRNGEATAPVIKGRYDVWLGRVAPWDHPDLPCHEVDRMGLTKVLSDIATDEEGKLIPLSASPQSVQVLASPSDAIHGSTNVVLSSPEIPGQEWAQPLGPPPVANAVLWPGAYVAETQFDLDGRVWSRRHPFEVTHKAEQRVEIPVGISRISGRVSLGSEGIDPGLRTLKLNLVPVGGEPGEALKHIGSFAEFEFPVPDGQWAITLGFENSPDVTDGLMLISSRQAVMGDMELGEVVLAEPATTAFRMASPPPESGLTVDHHLIFVGASVTQFTEVPLPPEGLRLLPGEYAVHWVLNERGSLDVKQRHGWRLPGCLEVEEGYVNIPRLDTNWQTLRIAPEMEFADRIAVTVRFLGNAEGTQRAWSEPLRWDNVFWDPDESDPIQIPLQPGFYEVAIEHDFIDFGEPIIVQFQG